MLANYVWLRVCPHCKCTRFPWQHNSHGAMQQQTPLDSLRKHVEERVEQLYPRAKHTDEEGAIPTVLDDLWLDKASSSAESSNRSDAQKESAYEMKQSTMPDAPDAPESLLAYTRPTLVVGEATAEDAQDNNALRSMPLQT